MKSKKICIYQDKKSKAIFICPMEDKGGKFVTKSPITQFGKAIGQNISDEELGKLIKKILSETD